LGLRLPGLHPHGGRPRPAGPGEAGRGRGRRPVDRHRLGSRLPAGIERRLSVRIRLLLAAAGIVGVSLLISGVLALVLVRSLEFDSAQLELDQEALTVQPQLLREACAIPPATATAACPNGRVADAVTYSDRVK